MTTPCSPCRGLGEPQGVAVRVAQPPPPVPTCPRRVGLGFTKNSLSLDGPQGCLGVPMSPFPALLLCPGMRGSFQGTCFGAVGCLPTSLLSLAVGCMVWGHRW